MNSNDMILYIVIYIIAFMVGVFITRAVFSIPKFLKLQEAQLQVLTEIAKQNGINDEILFTINSNLGIKSRPKTNQEIRLELKNSRKLQ